MDDKDVVDKAQDLGVVSISVNVVFGIDPHVRVGWARVVPHMSHTFSQVLAESSSSTLQAIYRTENDGFLTSISTPFIYKDGPDLFGNGCSCCNLTSGMSVFCISTCDSDIMIKL